MKGFLHLSALIIILVGLSLITLAGFLYKNSLDQNKKISAKLSSLASQNSRVNRQLNSVRKDFEELKNQDQVKLNLKNQEEIKNIQTTYKNSISTYEKLTDLKASGAKSDKLDPLYAKAVKSLADKNYSSASAQLAELDKMISAELLKLTPPAIANPPSTQNLPTSNTPPGSGYSRQVVHTDRGDFVVDIIAADLGSTKVIVDTASDSDCHDNCPVLSLADYVSRNGAFAAINGTYFCPEQYPSCAGKKNSFDLLVMNKNKKYFNSDNNIYSTNPAVIFLGGSIRFVSQALQWGRDTGVDGVISNFPLLLSGGNVTFSGNDDAKQSSKGNRSFIASKGNTVYIGVARNVSVAENATILKTLGMENAMNLDSGGSTALWSGTYKAGPGRNIPNAVLFLRK